MMFNFVYEINQQVEYLEKKKKKAKAKGNKAKAKDCEKEISVLKNIPEDNIAAVIDKWLTYTKSENLTMYQIWRLSLMQKKWNPLEQNALKICLRMMRGKDLEVLQSRTKSNDFHTDEGKYGPVFHQIYPLLDPNIATAGERLEKHRNWHKNPNEKSLASAFLTQGVELDENTFANMTAEDLGLKAPTFFKFMPSKEILRLLIKRAT
jgi:hypothetical protein